MSDNVLVVGTGLIGGSIGLAMRGMGNRVTGFDLDPVTLRQARELDVVDAVSTDLAAAAAEADIIFVCVPVGRIVATISTIAEHARPGTIVTDVGSTKGLIVSQAEDLLGPDRHFVGGHPMAGTEGEGIGAARPELFDSALWILTPTASTNSSAFRKINEIVAGLGASWMALDPDEHDRLVALVSHLPYALATCLMQMAARRGDERVFRAAAGSFRDVTRTAGSNAAIWRDILAANRSAVLDQLDTFIATITDFRASLEAGDFESLDAAIAEARAARSRFPVKGERQPGQPVTLDISVPDRTGVLAEITTTVGDLGINIEDLWMQHGPAGGTVRLVVDGQDAADAVVAALHTLEYRIQKVDEL